MFINTTTFRANTGSIARVNQDYQNTTPLGFVANLLLKIVERPAMQHRSLLALNRYPIAYPTQIFEGNNAMSALCNLYELFADTVVHIVGETLFLTRQMFKQSLGSLRSFLLQFCSQTAMAIANTFDVATRMEVPITIYGDIGNTQVNTQYTLNINGFGFLDIANCEQIKCLVDVDQIGFALLSAKQFKLAFGRCEGDGQTACYRPDGNMLRWDAPVQDAVIVGNSTMWLKAALSLFIQFVSIGHFRDTTDNYLCGQIKIYPHSSIDQLMQLELTKCLGIPCLMADVVTSRVRPFQCLKQVSVLVWCGEQFHLCSQFHTQNIAQRDLKFNIMKNEFRLSSSYLR